MTYRVIQRPVEEYIIPVLESEAAAHLVPLHWFKAGRRSTHLEPLHGQASVLKVAVHDLSVRSAAFLPEEVRRSDLCFGEVFPAVCAIIVASEG